MNVYEELVTLPGCKHQLRQVTIKDHGRAQPTFIITNNMNLSLTRIIEVYAKRWRIENKLAELVAFFNLNALSYPVIRGNLWTFSYLRKSVFNQNRQLCGGGDIASGGVGWMANAILGNCLVAVCRLPNQPGYPTTVKIEEKLNKMFLCFIST